MTIAKFFPHFLISSYLIRLLVTGSSIGDALTMLILGFLVAGHTYLEFKREPEANKDLKDAIKKLQESNDSVKSKVSSLTVGSAIGRK